MWLAARMAKVQSTRKATPQSLNNFDLFNTIWPQYIIILSYFIY